MTTTPEKTDTACYVSSVETCEKIKQMVDFSQYLSGSFNAGQFTNKFKEMNIILMKQFEDCQVIDLFINMDQSLSKIQNAIPTSLNGAAQIVLQFTGTQSTPLDVATKKLKEGWAESDNKKIGQGVMLAVNRLLALSTNPSGGSFSLAIVE